MSSSKVINYRNVYKSDHLGSIDLEEFIEDGRRLVFTIDHVSQHLGNNKIAVAGKKIECNIAHFKENIKPLVINATNGAVIKGFTGSVDINKWVNVPIELYIDRNVKMKGQVVGGIRIRPTQPTIEKPVLTPEHPKWADAVKACKNGTTIEQFNHNYSLTREFFELMQGAE